MTASSLRDQFLKRHEEAEDEIEEMDDPTPDPATYEAFSKGKQGMRGQLGMLLYYEDGQTIEVLYYSYLMRVIATSPQILSLMCSDCVYTVTGDNLMPLMPLLRDHKILFLQAFNDQKHPPLSADNDTPRIDTISMQSNDMWWQEYEARQAIREKTEQDA